MQTLAHAGLGGLSLALLSYGLATLLSLPLLWRERESLRGKTRQMLMIAVPGGWAAMSFMEAMSQGDVVREMLLFYLAPAWSLLGAVLLLKERLDRWRLATLALGMAGGAMVISAGGSVSTARLSASDLFALSAGVAFAAGNLAVRAIRDIPMASKSVLQVAGCTACAAVNLGLMATPVTWPGTSAWAGVVVFTLVWIIGGTSTTVYGMSHLPASRAALILLAELISAVVSASWVLQRVPQRWEWIGGLLILAAAALDASLA
jgi:drug/metabolite transporter (DMT)-like permease